MTRLPLRSRLATTPLLTISVVVASALAATLAGSAATAAPAARAAAPPAGSNSELYAVTVAPKSTDAWALVNNHVPTSTATGDAVLRRHKNHWSKVAVKGTPASSTYLNGVAAGSPKLIWLVGDRLPSTSATTYIPVIARSKGATFKKVALKGFARGRLLAVAASSASNAWVIGESADNTKNVSFHWNGKKWKQIAVPLGASGVAEQAVVSTSGPNNTWLLGIGSGAVLDHWNGHKWAAAPLPSPSDIGQSIATSGAHTWVVGYTSSASSTTPLALRRAGTSWKPVPLKHAASNEVLESVAAVGASAFAVGHQTALDSSTAAPIAAKLHGTKGTLTNAAAAGKYAAMHAVAASTKSVLGVGDYETKGYCKSPFHSLAETVAHAKWKRVAIPARLVPASATGPANCF